jgi:phage terminase large subunit-like protein
LSLPPETLSVIREDSWRGFGAFYLLIHNLTIPEHALEWIRLFYEAQDKDKGIVIEAFRGSTKTQTLNTFVAYKTGLKPEGSSLVIKSGDESAGRSSKAIAAIIEHNPAWQAIFDHVVPDPQKGWGERGYWVKDTRYSYADWNRLLIGPDPSIVALSYRSKAIIGMHPSNVLLVDDIHTQENVDSDLELQKVKDTLTSTIFPTRSPHDPMTMFIATPWKDNDAIQAVKATGEYIAVKTPVYKEKHLVENGTPVWPEYFDTDKIERERKQDLSGGIDFARMFLVNVDAAKGRHLRRDWLHKYPADSIDSSWPVVFGIDPASTADKLRAKKHDLDYFALSIGRLIPGGGVILVDGLRMRLSQGEIIDKMESMAYAYPTMQLCIIETYGMGDQILQLLLRNTSIYVLGATAASKMSDMPKIKDKGSRFEKQLGALFRSTRVWVTSEENDYINTFTNEWLSYPDGAHDDTLDATFYMVYAAMMQGGLAMTPDIGDEIQAWWGNDKSRKKSPSPWSMING